MRRRGFDSPHARQSYDDVGKLVSHHSLKVVIAGSSPAIVAKFGRRKLTPATTNKTAGGARFDYNIGMKVHKIERRVGNILYAVHWSGPYWSQLPQAEAFLERLIRADNLDGKVPV